MEKVKKATTAKKAAKTAASGIEPKKTAAKKKSSPAAASVDGAVPKKVTPTVKKSNVTQMQAAAPNRAAIRVSHEEIARLAHRYWAERGRQHGHHEEDWLRAERELLGKAS
jgi:ABC-type uncharacterized transport system auxiliary subunit